ncbi:hypothetical protein D5H75_32930 [Bailinhaonella thermotolerans]|uniref:DUF6879 domain-containing protein n=1 Tax=Bailinhaonella thermotolerans TaxID=1070861 RepID=A0A3A4A5Z7_9ACTN|nr:hypothetical protein D5H75_32930 [Bailinhaonella thermotolerans]
MPPFHELIASTTRSAIHLEMRDTYTPNEPSFLRWKETGEVAVEEFWSDWKALVRATVTRGVTIRRARIVSEPITDFIRLEYEMTGPLNVAAGEQVRWLPRRQASDLALPGNDFWVFDDKLVRFGHFAGDGTFTEHELRDEPHVIQLCATAFEAVWERAIDHSEYKPL